MAKKENSAIVKIGVRKHSVTIADELVVNIRHNKDCQKPCPESKNIVNYLQSEMFLAEGFVVADEHK
jgi:hypothetical protein